MQAKDAGQKMRDKATIAIIAPLEPEDFFDLLWQGVWEATFDLASFGVEVQNLTSRHDDVRGQRKILEALLDSRPDAIGLSPVYATELKDLIDLHVLRGTPVVTFHSDAPDSKRVAFVHPDLYQAGLLAGEVLAKQIHGPGRVLSFPGSLDEYYLAQRYQGFRDGLARFGGQIEEVQCGFKGNPATGITPQYLEALGPVVGYYVGNEDLVSIANAIEQLGEDPASRTPCIGFSNTERVRPFLERGVISAVIDENRYKLGYFAVQKAYEAVLKLGTDAPVVSVKIPSTVIFAANAAGAGDSLDNAFHLLLRQRTDALVSYKTRLEEANVKLLDLAVTDPLTGLFNRRKFDETLNQEVSRALRYGPVSLAVIDLDYFKSVNDRYGHQAGDDALKAVAKVLQASCRTTDTCARLGGDEFGIILPHSDANAAEVVRRRIQYQIARTLVPMANGEVRIGLSIGVATLPGDASNTAGLIAAADAAMYQVKQASRCEPSPVSEAS
jgi:diguanylate cyclase (GGDEF)-like protein